MPGALSVLSENLFSVNQEVLKHTAISISYIVINEKDADTSLQLGVVHSLVNLISATNLEVLILFDNS